MFKRPVPACAAAGRCRCRDRTGQCAGRAGRAVDAPAIFVPHEDPGDALAFGSEGRWPDPWLRGEPSDRYIRKTTPDSFLRTRLNDVRSFLRVEERVICGDATARSAAAHGYAKTLAADAHTTHDKPHAKAWA